MRVAEQVQRTLSEMLRREVNDPRLKPLTITHVRVSPDLSHAWVNYTLLAGDSDDPEQLEILEESARRLRGPLTGNSSRVTASMS
jgi:ribosome-binding factor A